MKVPYTLATLRIDREIHSLASDITKLQPEGLDVCVLNEFNSLKDVLKKFISAMNCRSNRDTSTEGDLVAVYNACAMFTNIGSFSELSDKYDQLSNADNIVGILDKYFEEYPPEQYERRWCACTMCGKETQLYYLKPDLQHPWFNFEHDSAAVREFRDISHICDKCWQRYIYKGE